MNNNKLNSLLYFKKTNLINIFFDFGQNKFAKNLLKMLFINKRGSLAIIFSLTVLISYSPKILAQIESIYNANSDQFAGISNLMSAVANNDIQGAKFFSKGGSLVVNQKNKGGATALHIACRESNFEIVKILIESGANPNIQDNEGWTPLMRASNVGNSQIVEYLLANGAKANYLNSQNETAIIHSTISRCTECINHIIEKGNLAKELDTLVLKSQIADAFLIARNQEHKNNQGILESYLDYISKISPLNTKQNFAQNKFDNPPLSGNEKSFILKNPDNFDNKFNDNSYGFLSDPNKPNIAPPNNFNQKINQPKYSQTPETKEFDLDLEPKYNNFTAKDIDTNQSYAPVNTKPKRFKFSPMVANTNNLNSENTNQNLTNQKITQKYNFKKNSQNNLPSKTDNSLANQSQVLNNQTTNQLDIPKKFKFTPLKNTSNLTPIIDSKNITPPNQSVIDTVDDSSTIQLLEKRNTKTLNIDNKQNNKTPIEPNIINDSANKNLPQVPKIFKFKSSNPSIDNKSSINSVLPVEKSQSIKNDSVKKFKFVPLKSSKNIENSSINSQSQTKNSDDSSKNIDQNISLDQHSKSLENNENPAPNENFGNKIFKFFKSNKSTPDNEIINDSTENNFKINQDNEIDNIEIIQDLSVDDQYENKSLDLPIKSTNKAIIAPDKNVDTETISF
jgi:ankyrin repeat protein